MASRIAEIAKDMLAAAPQNALVEARRRAVEASAKVKIGIITALPKEAAAVQTAFDATVIPLANKRSHVSYQLLDFECSTTGVRRQVILALANKMGNNAAAVTAASLLMDYEGIEDLVLVGIAGGIPVPVSIGRSKKDYERHVRLGDIVVSTEGVLQYDFVKIERDKSELRALPRPPSPRLLKAVNELRTEEENDAFPWQAALDALVTVKRIKRPVKDEMFEEHRKPRPSPQRLQHPSNQAGRRTRQPFVHYARIGSANVLVKNAKYRDRLATKHQLRAVEMEGSGIADAAWSFSAGYLVVRGVCDYCDMRKDDPWQKYASHAAAVYSRAVIERALSDLDD